MDIKHWLLAQEQADILLIKDISTHGCSGGQCCFLFKPSYSFSGNCVRFHDEHEKEIWDLLFKYAEHEGLKLVDKLAQVSKDVESLTQLKNELVWWAVEVRAHEICDEREAEAE